jgi:hypothetical protein
MFTLRRAAALAVVPVLVAAAGCGAASIAASDIPAQPVHGTITLGGKPMTAGYLNLTLVTNTEKYGKAQAVAEIKPDGTFEPHQVGDKTGLVPGRWKVAVNPTYVRDGKMKRLSVPAKYTNEDTTDLVIDVVEGDNAPTLTLK